MDFRQLNAFLVFCEVHTLVSFDKVTVVDLTKFFIVEILYEKMNHIFVLLFNWFRWFIFFDLLLFKRSINQKELICLLRHKLPIPTNKKIISIKVRSTNLGSHWIISFHWEYNTVYQVTKVVLLSPELESLADFEL